MTAATARPALLPAGGLHLPTAAVIAVMTFAMMLVAAAGLALAGASGDVARGIDNRFVIQLPAGTSGRLDEAVAIAKAAPGVVEAAPIPESEMRDTLRRWLGDSASSRDLPVPALVRVGLAEGADAEALARRVERAIPAASVTSESAELRPLLRSLRTLQWLALALVLAIVAATAAAVVLAARGAFDTHRPTIEIMHGIGATDRQLARLFIRKIALDALVGAGAGALVAAVGLLLLRGGGEALSGGLVTSFALSWWAMLLLALLPVLAVGLAAAVAAWTVLRALRETL